MPPSTYLSTPTPPNRREMHQEVHCSAFRATVYDGAPDTSLPNSTLRMRPSKMYDGYEPSFASAHGCLLYCSRTPRGTTKIGSLVAGDHCQAV